MVGSISVPVAASSITSIPPGVVTSKFFGYDHTYYMSDTLFPSRGYWVKVDQPAKLILGRQTSFLAKNRITISETTTEMPPAPPGMELRLVSGLPKAYALESAFPNPFNPTTTIRYELPYASKVTVRVFDILGQVVAILSNRVEQPGEQSVQWNAAGFSSGVYFYKLEATSLDKPTKTFTQVRKMVLMK